MIIAVFIHVDDDIGMFTHCIQLRECAVNLILKSYEGREHQGPEEIRAEAKMPNSRNGSKPGTNSHQERP